ncbi:MAG: hypothetical protein EXQ52_02110 [Bryobacterales bacterium]|nr:hypothetical protein [Bryobacterales bacterium]
MLTQVSISRKMILIALTFSLPIAVLTYLMVVSIDSNVEFAVKETKGNTVQRGLAELLRKVQEHRLARLGCQNGQECEGRLSVLQAEVGQAFQQTQAALDQVGAPLQFTTAGLGARGRQHLSLETMRREWSELTGKLPDADLAAKHDHLASDIRGMITHAGDTSNLILDPDLDSYYLMDVTLLALPQAQERLARVGVLGSAIIRGGKLTRDDQIQLAVQASMMQEADLDRIVASTGTSLTEDPNFYGVRARLQERIPPALKRYQAAASTFIGMSRRLASAERPEVTEKEYLQAEDEAHRASFEFWSVAVDELDGLLGARIASYQDNRNWSLGLASLSVLVACLLAFFLARSIVVPLRDVMGSLGPGATLLGVCVERIAEASKNHFSNPEEATLICEELDAHADGMRQSVLALALQVEGAQRAESVAVEHNA